MPDNVRIAINLTSGEVTIDAPASMLSDVFDRLESFVPRLRKAAAPTAVPDAQDSNSDGSNTDASALSSGTTQTAAPKRIRSSTGKPESYKAVDLGLTPEQRAALRAFYASKAPRTQNDQVLVVIYWLINNTTREKVTMDEIFVGLRTVGEKIPKRISSVLSNLALAAHVSKENNEPRLLHVGEDHVMHNLPRNTTEKS